MRGKVRRVTYSDSYFSGQYSLFPFHIEENRISGQQIIFTRVNPNFGLGNMQYNFKCVLYKYTNG